MKSFRFLPYFLVVMYSLVTISCIGEDSVNHEPESTVTNCTDGKDNDGDGHFDCYDPDCTTLSKSLADAGQEAICVYTQILVPTRSSSLPSSSSSLGVSSAISSSEAASSSSSSSVPTFPLEISLSSDTVEIMDLALLPNDLVVFVGRRRDRGLVGQVDSTGAVQFEFTTPNYDNTSLIRFHTVQAQDSTQLLLGGIGKEAGDTKGVTTLFNLSSRTAPTLRTLGFGNAEIWLASPTNNRVCISVTENPLNAAQRNGWLFLMDPTTDSINLPLNLSRGHMRRGLALNNGGCVAVGFVDSTASRSTMFLSAITNTNAQDFRNQFTAGGSVERAHDIVTTENGYAVAAEIDGQVRVLLLNTSAVVQNAGNNLGAGIPHRIKAVVGGGFLVAGNTNDNQARIWLTNASGDSVSSRILPGEIATSAIQFTSGNFLVSSYSHSQGKSWIHKISEDLSQELE